MLLLQSQERHPRVLILAQGGVGKTREMQEQAAALCNSGKAAFFMPLELLDDDPVSEILGFDDGHRFETWLNEEDTLGWFFLDSVDELKITHGTLQRALGKFAASLGRDALRRARIILSCRPKDWSETIDRGAVERTISLPPAPMFAGTSEEDAFVATLHRDRDTGNRQDDEADTDALKIVMLLPLDRKRTRQFAEARDIPDIDGFMDEVIRRNADEFVKRPMDLITITDMWTTHRKLGTRREQLELNIQSNLIEDAETLHQKESMSVSRAREGVNRIALAMALAKRSSIHADAPSLARRLSPSTLSAEAILHDWDPSYAFRADRWRYLSLEKVAEQADFTPYGVDAIQTFEQRHELPPRNSEELLEVVIDRLDDLGHDLHHHRFSPLKTWRQIENEADAQCLLAARLESTRLDSYTAVTREEEVAERNRTDVTLSTLGNDAEQAVIEIKIANKNRTATTLAQDIEEQLVAKYLRHDQCRAGCFLVINGGDKATWQHPTTRKRMRFSGLMDFLANTARDVEKRSGHRIKLAVFGLDLTDDGATRHAFKPKS